MQNFTLHRTNNLHLNPIAGFFSKKLLSIKRLRLLALVMMLGVNGVVGQTTLAVGDLSIIGFNSNTPDGFAFVTWVDIANNTYIKFTDNGFLATSSANTSNNGRGGENFVIWRNNTGNSIAAGTVIRIIDNSGTATTNTGTIVSGNLNGISNSGDQIFAYQGSATSGANPDWTSNANPTTFNGTILFGLNFGANWLTTGTASSNTSYLPTQLNVSNGNIVLSTNNTAYGQYTGSRNNQTTISAYKSIVNNSSNWTTATSGTITLNTTAFTLAAPTISTTGALAAVNTTYGSASATPTSFSVSGTNMTAGILVTPPSTNFEVSLTSGSGYANTITVGAAGTISLTTVYLRLKPTATVSGSPYSGNIVLSSSGATDVNVATVSSSVSAKALTITGLTGDAKDYDATTTATATGTAAYTGLENSESFSVTGTPTYTFASANASGSPVSISTSGFTAPSTN